MEKNLKEQIVYLLPNDNIDHVDAFASYCQRLLIEKDKKTGKNKNPWMQTKKADQLAQLFSRVKGEGLVFDGKHVSLQSTGISYDYVAYKNKMILAYPESMIDMDVIKDGDTFTTSKESGKVIYSHTIKDPFQTADFKTIVGAYCVVKNKRGEFMTLLSKEDIAKSRKVAKGDFIWQQWFKEMVLKTVLKKACKYHFEDTFESMNNVDNESIDLSNISLDDENQDKVDLVIKKIKSFKTLKSLQAFYLGLSSEFIKNEDVISTYNQQKDICKNIK